jgi:tetratricopeptide (TPR) repeat protein
LVRTVRFHTPFAKSNIQEKREEMEQRVGIFKCVISAAVIGAVLSGGLPARGQDLIPVSDISGGSSVFVFRRAARAVPKKFTSSVSGSRTKSQRQESARKVNKQYVQLAKVAPRRVRSAVVDPEDARLKDIPRMPRDQASRLFAGVGEYYMDRDDFDHAIDFFRESVQLDDVNKSAKTGLSEALALKGNDTLIRDGIPASKPFFEEALKYNPQNSPAYFGLAEVYSELNKNDEAIENYENALKYDKDLTEIFTPLGILYYQKGEIAKSEDFLTRALATASGNTDPQLQFFIGLIRYAQNKNTDALAAFKKAESLDPNLAEAYYQAGETLTRLEKHTEAIDEYRRAVEIKPMFFDAWVGLGDAYFALNNYPEAVKAYKEAVRINNRSIEAYTNLGDANRLAGNFNDAEAAYTLATTFIEQKPDYPKDDAADTYSKISFVIAKQCEISSKQGIPCRWDNAVRALEKAVAITGSNVDVANLGWAYYNAARTDLFTGRDATGAKTKMQNAKVNLEKAVFTDSKFVEGPLLNLALTLNDLGDQNGAIDVLKRVVAKKPDWVFALNELGIAYRKQNNYSEAAKYFRSAIGRDNKYVYAYYNLAESEFQAGHMAEAKKAYQKVKELDPNNLAKKLVLLTGGQIARG